MAKAKTPTPKLEDEAQSRRFVEMARELESDGGLSPTDAEKRFEALFRSAVKSKAED